MANTYLTRTPSSTGNRQIFTYSAWVKRSQLSAYNTLFYAGANSSTGGTIAFRFTNNDNLNVYIQDIGQFITTNRLFRDTSAWYHIVLAIDTTQATPDDRRKLYINGVQETSFSTSTEVNRNLNLSVNTSGQLQRIGTYADSGGSLEGYFNGLMSYVAFVDGTAELPTIFGETDSVTGQWKIKTDITPSVAWGTNGFLILKNGNSLTDESTNSNNFTLGGGTLTNTEDSPSNVFATMNALQYSPNTTFSNGNNVVTQSVGGNGARRFTSTLGASSGKYYWETKITGTVNGMTFGIVDGVEGDYNNYVGYKSKEVGYEKDGVIYKNAVAVTTGLTVVALNDVVNHALDLDNGYIYFGVNGTWQNSGVPTSGATGTGGFSITADTLYHPAVSAFANTGQISCNFGNGYFGTTAVTSAGTAGSTPGIFEYDVPSGYQPLSTKGLNA